MINIDFHNIIKTSFIAIFLMTVMLVSAEVPAFDSDKPVKTFASAYSQDFSTVWDNTKFYGQWEAMQPGLFTAADISSGYLQYSWITKRSIYSKIVYSVPYSFETDLDYSTGSNRGGVVIRANVTTVTNADYLQEPPTDPGFNREGIAFYPTTDGLSMIVQFSGTETGRTTTTRTQITVPKPAAVTSLLSRGVLKIEDAGTSIYVYYNNAPFIRINLGGKTGSIYTSGTVYNADMQVVGTFSGMEVELRGKVAVAQRDAMLRLYSATINYNLLQQQTINFGIIAKKLITDPPFTLSATATSGLAVDFKLISGPATLVGNTVTLTGEPGVVTISANQSGNSTYDPAPETLRSIYVSNPTVVNIPTTSQDYTDNWVVTDALGRQLPDYEEVGSKRTNKQVGVFYMLLHGAHANKVYDITKILANYPADALSANNTAWAGNTNYFWGEPEVGYFRAEDPWVIRYNLQMLSNAHVDFLYFDATNSYTYPETVKTLCSVSLQMRKEGIYTPQIVFTTNSSSGATMNKLYDEFYAPTLYDELWFKWDGKPLILGDFNDTTLRAEVKNFFTIKYCWAWTDQTNANYWQWIDPYPQDYGWSVNPAIPEQIPVSVASHPNNSKGGSYHNGVQPPVKNSYLTDFTGQGLHFAEQWTQALKIDPPVVMVTQWNEFIATRKIWDQGNAIYAGRPIKDGDSYFIDVLNEEFNRDMAPMKGGHTDNFYYQLIANMRKYKGMSAPQVFSTSTTINIDGNFTEWSSVTPVFRDPLGDVTHRDFKGFDPTTIYTNNTGRNDIVESRSTYDSNNIYFYVKAAQAITPFSDPNWMLLFIDADRNKGTGWEGYDYVLNFGVKSASETTLKKWDGSNWTNEVSIAYKLSGNEMELSVPRTAIMMDKATPEFYFHWSDNAQQLKDITAFFMEGESAPDRRFNFNYSTSKIVANVQTSFKTMTIPGTVEFEDFDNGGAGVAYSDATIGNAGGTFRPNESVDIYANVGGGNYLGSTNANEWLEYTVDVKSIGTVTASIQYASNSDGNEAILYVDGVDKSGSITFPNSGGLLTWATKNVDIQLTAGKHTLKFLINKAADDFNLDKIDFTGKNVVYPGNGTGLNKSIWTAPVGGRTWFKDSICSEIDPILNHEWADVSPGCSVSKDFWNIRWRGQLDALYTETYTLYLTVNDMGRVWINNQLVVDGWLGTSSGTTVTGTIALTAGEKVPIRVDFAEKTGDAKVKLEWSSASNPREVIPQNQLFPLSSTNAITDVRSVYFGVYPNPATDKITIRSDQYKVNGINIFDLQGRAVYSNNIKFIGQENLEIILEKGIYFVRLTGDVTFGTHKLIIK